MTHLGDRGRSDPLEPDDPARLTGADVTRIVWRGVIAGLVGWLLMRGVGIALPIYALLPVGIAGFAVARVVRATHPPDDEPLPRAAASDPPPDRPFAEVTRLEDRLAWAQQDRAHFDSVVRPQLLELLDERLRQHHGVQRATDPQLARTILGEDLWQLAQSTETTRVTRPAGRSGPAPAEIARLVRLIEAV